MGGWPSISATRVTTSWSIDHEVEITDAGAVLSAVTTAQPEAVYHLAALTHVGESWDDPLRVLEVNVLGTAAVLAAARRCGTDPRVLVTSSSEVYGVVTDPTRAADHRDVADRSGDPLRGEQAGRRGGVRPGLRRPRTAGHRGPALQPHRPGPEPDLRGGGIGPAHRRGIGRRRRQHRRGQPHRPA